MKTKNESSGVYLLVTMLFFMFGVAFLYLLGAADNNNTWTASDMRGEVQKRLGRLEEREQRETVPWKQLKIQAERDELLAITEPYE